jgi:NhaA family Na+:H+ antiporter
VAGAGLLGAIGFTVSLFVTDLAFDDALRVSDAKIGILAASTLAAILGYAWLRLQHAGTTVD